MKGLVDSHHIIPRNLDKHELLSKLRYDVHRSYNLMYLPSITLNGMSYDHFPHVHKGGHRKYNAYVRESMDSIVENTNNSEEMRYEFWLLVKHLHAGILDRSIPWN